MAHAQRLKFDYLRCVPASRLNHVGSGLSLFTHATPLPKLWQIGNRTARAKTVRASVKSNSKQKFSSEGS